MKKKLLLIALLVFGAIWGAMPALAQVDTEFWFVAPEVFQGHGDRPIQLRVATLDEGATVEVSMPANSGFAPLRATIAANSLQVFDLTSFIDQIENRPANTVLNKGLRITSSAPITAYYEVNTSCLCNPDIFPLKGKNALGTEFFVIAQNHWRNAFGTSSFDIVATEDGTQVTITPSKSIVGRAAGQSFTITLNKGETYSAEATGTNPEDHLGGSRVTSNKPIAITLKDDSLQSAEYGICADLMGEQMVPVGLAGDEYIVMKGSLNGADRVFVLATQNGTQVTVAGNNVATINAGETFTTTITAATTYITTSKPTHVLHITGFGCEVGGSILPSVKCTGSEQVSFVRSTNELFKLNLMVKAIHVGGFSIGGAAFPAGSFSPVPNTNGEWVSAQLSSLNVGVGTQTIITNSQGRFHLGIINGGASTGCRYGYFSSYSRFAFSIAGDPEVCPGQTISLQADAIEGAVYQWTGPNNFSSTNASINIPNAQQANAGAYTVSGSVEGCETAPATVNVQVLNQPTPTVSISPSSPNLCVGESVTLTPNIANEPASGVAFEWLVNGQVRGNARNFTSSSWTNGDQVQVRLNLSGPDTRCIPVSQVQSDPITVSVVTPTPATATIDGPASVCVGDEATFTAVTTNAGTPTFQWSVNGQAAGSNAATFSSSSLNNGDRIGLTIQVGGCTPTPTVVATPITVTVKSFTTSATASGPLCPGETLQLEAQAVANATSYAWSGPGGFSAQGRTVSVPNIQLSQAGTYTVVATAEGCQTPPANAQAQVLDQPTPSATLSPTSASICVGESAAFSVQVNNAPSSGMAIEWQVNGQAIAGATGTNFNTSNLSDGDQVRAVLRFSGDNTRCYPFRELPTAAVRVTVSDPPPATVSVQASLPRICQGDEVTFTATPANAGNAPTFRWTVNGQEAGGNSRTFTTRSLKAGDEVQVEIGVSIPCTPTPRASSEPVSIDVVQRPEIPLSELASFCPEKGEVLRLDARISGQASYLWTPSGQTSSAIEVDAEGVYEVEVTLPSGCSASARVRVVSRCPMEVYVPNAFSPNGDARNELFRVFGTNIAGIDFRIFNRWGEVIYQSESLDDQWDGTYLGVPVQAGTYFWRLVAIPIGANERVQDLKGELTIFRE